MLMCVCVCVCACVCVHACFYFYSPKLSLEGTWELHKDKVPQGRGTGQPGSKNNFSQINFALLLNFEPSKYIAIKKGQEKKPLQGCSLRLSHLEKYPRRLWRECLWGEHWVQMWGAAISRRWAGNRGSGREGGERAQQCPQRDGIDKTSGGSSLDCFKACWILLRFVVVV